MPAPECSDCRYYFASPLLDEPACRRGVTYGRHHVPTPAISTMRHDNWWGQAGCGKDGKLWEPCE
jgi:hypothetical protein